MSLPPYDAVILAGGAARRLGGVDKPGQLVGSLSLLERVLSAVPDAGRRIVVGPRRELAVVDEWVREDPPGGGPAPALAAALPMVTAEFVALLAGDLPFLTAEAIRTLREAAAEVDGALAVDDDRRDQILLGIWRTELLRGLDLQPGARIGRALGSLHVRRLRLPGSPPPWMDCDTSDELRQARELA